MHLDSIKDHLRPYRIVAKRSTTINHAFASAIASVEPFSLERVRAAVEWLGPNPDLPWNASTAVRRRRRGTTLRGRVTAKEYSGFGHVLGNLVPCCKPCNSAKGSKDWRAYLRSRALSEEDLSVRERLIAGYVEQFLPLAPTLEDLRQWCPNETAEFEAIRARVLALLAEADRVAAAIQQEVRARFESGEL